MVEGVIDMLIYPIKNAIPDTMGPAMLVKGKQKLDFGKKIIEFRAYAMVYVGTHNNTKKKELTISRLESVQRGRSLFLMSLYSGKIIHSYIWEEIPIHQKLIEIVEKLTREEK